MTRKRPAKGSPPAASVFQRISSPPLGELFAARARASARAISASVPPIDGPTPPLPTAALPEGFAYNAIERSLDDLVQRCGDPNLQLRPQDLEKLRKVQELTKPAMDWAYPPPTPPTPTPPLPPPDMPHPPLHPEVRNAPDPALGPRSYAKALAPPTSSRSFAAPFTQAHKAKAPCTKPGPPAVRPAHITEVHRHTRIFAWPVPPPEDWREATIHDLRLGFSAEQYAVWWTRRGNLAVTFVRGTGSDPSQALWAALFIRCTLDPAYAGSFNGVQVLEDRPWSQVVVRGVPAAYANITAIKTAIAHVFTSGSPSMAASAVTDVRSLLKPGLDSGEPRTVCISFAQPKIADAVIRNGLVLQGFLFCTARYCLRCLAAQPAA